MPDIRRFKMTEDDIEAARQHIWPGFHECPVAQCLKRETGSSQCGAGTNELMIVNRFFPAPSIVVEFIRRFDSHAGPVELIEFEVDLEENISCGLK